MLVVLPVAASPDTISPRRAPISRWFISTSICPSPVRGLLDELEEIFLSDVQASQTGSPQ